MKTYRIWISLICFTFLLSCANNDDSTAPDDDPTSTSSKPNILLIIADDMGLDANQLPLSSSESVIKDELIAELNRIRN